MSATILWIFALIGAVSVGWHGTELVMWLISHRVRRDIRRNHGITK